MTKREYIGAFVHHWATALICAALVSLVLGPAFGVAFGAVLGAGLGVKVVRDRSHDAAADRKAVRMAAGPAERPRLIEVTADASILDPTSGRPVDTVAS